MTEPSEIPNPKLQAPIEESAAKEPRFTAEDEELIASVRRQCDAKAAAELIIGKNKTVRPKQIRGKACLFVGADQRTFYVGYTWPGAVARLIYLVRKHGHLRHDLLEEILAAERREAFAGKGGDSNGTKAEPAASGASREAMASVPAASPGGGL